MTTKRCSLCGEEKPDTREFFIVNKTCRGGVAGRCRRCSTKYLREWKAARSERLAKRRREIYASKTLSERNRKEHERASRRPLFVRASRLRGGMRTRSKELGLPFDSDVLTVKWLMELLIVQPTCECCGVEFDIGYKLDWQKKDNSPSIDRIVPRLGYVVGNVALICWRCNNLKRDATADELFRVAMWIASKTARAVEGLTA